MYIVSRVFFQGAGLKLEWNGLKLLADIEWDNGLVDAPPSE